MYNKEKLKTMDCVELFAQVKQRMTSALLFHESMSDYFNFLGLKGFKRKHECQYFEEAKGRRKLIRKFIKAHHKLLPKTGHDKIDFIPAEWYKHSTFNIDDGMLPKAVRAGLKEYREWEEQTKALYCDIHHVLLEKGYIVETRMLSCYIDDVQKELNNINKTIAELNNVGYDVMYIMEMQKCMHDKYKEKTKHIKM